MSRLNEIKSELEKVVNRFPLVLTSAVAAICIVLVVIGNVRNSIDNNYWLTWAYALYLGIPLHFSAVIAIESRDFDKRKRVQTLLIGVVLHALIITHLLLARNEPESQRIQIFFFYFISCHLLNSFLPFLVGMKKEYFWNFNHWMFSRFVLSSVFSAILAAGLGLAFGAMQLLFGKINEELIGQVVFFAATLLHVLYFFAGTPEELNNGNWIVDPAKPFRILVQYIFVPLILLYLTILYLYLAKILFLFELPKGNVSIWILVFCTIGILAILLAEPFRKMESNWVGKFAKLFYWLMLPLLVMLWIAIFTRVLEYGLTESRGLVLYLAIWLTFISLYNGFYKKKSLLAFPISLFIITFLYQWGGPLSAHSLSFRSQSARTETLLAQDSIDEDELRSQLNYMYIYHKDKAEWFAANQLPLIEDGYAYDDISELIATDRFEGRIINRSQRNEYPEIENVYIYEYSIQGYDELFEIGRGAGSTNWLTTADGCSFQFKDGETTITHDCSAAFFLFCKQLKLHQKNYPAFTQEWTEGNKQFKLIVHSYRFETDPSNSNKFSTYVNGAVLLVKR